MSLPAPPAALVFGLVGELFAGRGWLALGYQSWTTWPKPNSAKSAGALSRGERKQAVTAAAASGMSGRANAMALGISAMTVSLDVREANVVRDVVVGEDGRVQAPN